MNNYISIAKNAIDITGQRFGRLVVLGPIGHEGRHIAWECACDCGKTTVVAAARLRKGTTQSCGCLQKELVSRRTRTHGMSHTKLFIKWQSMNRRCHDPKCNSYKNYGARGISVCQEWRDSFDSFFADVSQLPHYDEEGYTLDRINNDGNYEPSNIRWASYIQQHRNTRNNRLITHGGKTQCVADWAEEVDISARVLYLRLYRGWPIERALTTPPRRVG